MARSLFLVTITGFWLTMMTLLIQKEFFGLAPIQARYEVLPLQTSPMREGYLAYYLGDHRMGFGQAVLISNEAHKEFQDPEATSEEVSKFPFTLKHSSYLTFLLLGHENEMFVRGEADLDDYLNLQGFSVRIKNQDYVTSIVGELSDDGKTMQVIIEDEKGGAQKQAISLKGPVVHSEAIAYVWTPNNLKVGKRGRFHIWNPLLLQPEDIEFFVSHKSSLMYQDQKVDVLIVSIKKGEIETRAWMTPEGEMLQLETPTGILMRKEPGWMIFDGMREGREDLPDLPNLYSIASNQILENPESLTYLKAKITLPKQERILEIRRQLISKHTNLTFPLAPASPELLPYLEPTEFVQADDADIMKTAKEIVGDERGALNAVLKLVSWVNRNVVPVPTSSLPSASQVLKVRRGDCNEYTTLFTALARSLGIPTRMMAGLVYQNGRFFYHAWPEVHLADWVALDPTFGQAPADVTHLPLVEGDVKNQLALLNVIGNIKVSILETGE